MCKRKYLTDKMLSGKTIVMCKKYSILTCFERYLSAINTVFSIGKDRIRHP